MTNAELHRRRSLRCTVGVHPRSGLSTSASVLAAGPSLSLLASSALAAAAAAALRGALGWADVARRRRLLAAGLAVPRLRCIAGLARELWAEYPLHSRGITGD